MGKFTFASPSQQLYRNEGSFDHSSIGKEMHLDGVSLFGQSQTLFAVLVAAVLWHFSTKPNFISVDYNWGSNHNHNKCLVGKNAAATALYTWLNPRRDECVVQCCVEQLLLHTTLLALLFRCNIDTHICRVEEKNSFLYLDVGRDMEVCVPANNIWFACKSFSTPIKICLNFIHHSSSAFIIWVAIRSSDAANESHSGYLALSSAGGILIYSSPLVKKK